ncbi:hypothetical protein TCAL_17028 [Tigriopus californicus]|uniref:Uncharacterized protein n=1 Tax=Tigriopus californicus TaxID=6832 RepID=A0A553PFR5_TIGCA|nr:hypothetical protein TCAL_17028 [Tigriopus californicus]
MSPFHLATASKDWALDRFVFMNHTQGAVKLEKAVQFNVNDLDLTPHLSGPLQSDSPPHYDLYACVNHFGGLAIPAMPQTSECKSNMCTPSHHSNVTSILPPTELQHGFEVQGGGLRSLAVLELRRFECNPSRRRIHHAVRVDMKTHGPSTHFHGEKGVAQGDHLSPESDFKALINITPCAT